MIISVRATDVPKLILLAFWAENRSKKTKLGDRVFGDHFLAKYHQFFEKVTKIRNSRGRTQRTLY